MKIKENQLAVFELREPEGLPYDVFSDESFLYFTPGSELKHLRRNSRYLKFHDGCNYREIEIKFVKIIDAKDYKSIIGNPAYNFRREYELEDGSILKLITSNESRHLTPYWEEETPYC
jgi:hypothetical protein